MEQIVIECSSFCSVCVPLFLSAGEKFFFPFQGVKSGSECGHKSVVSKVTRRVIWSRNVMMVMMLSVSGSVWPAGFIKFDGTNGAIEFGCCPWAGLWINSCSWMMSMVENIQDAINIYVHLSFISWTSGQIHTLSSGLNWSWWMTETWARKRNIRCRWNTLLIGKGGDRWWRQWFDTWNEREPMIVGFLIQTLNGLPSTTRLIIFLMENVIEKSVSSQHFGSGNGIQNFILKKETFETVFCHFNLKCINFLYQKFTFPPTNNFLIYNLLIVCVISQVPWITCQMSRSIYHRKVCDLTPLTWQHRCAVHRGHRYWPAFIPTTTMSIPTTTTVQVSSGVSSTRKEHLLRTYKIMVTKLVRIFFESTNILNSSFEPFIFRFACKRWKMIDCEVYRSWRIFKNLKCLLLENTHFTAPLRRTWLVLWVERESWNTWYIPMAFPHILILFLHHPYYRWWSV